MEFMTRVIIWKAGHVEVFRVTVQIYISGSIYNNDMRIFEMFVMINSYQDLLWRKKFTFDFSFDPWIHWMLYCRL